MTLLELFCLVDDFCKDFEPCWNQFRLPATNRPRISQSRMSFSEIMTITIYFHQSGYRNFKKFYIENIGKYHQLEFPNLVSYTRFVELMSEAFIPVSCFLKTQYGQQTGIAFIDATDVAVCHNRRIASNKVFQGLAKRGKTSTGYFYGFKVHLVINDCGELVAVKITPGNCDDRVPVPDLTKLLFGKLIGDTGYISHPLFCE
jgi:hypothetical protein